MSETKTYLVRVEGTAHEIYEVEATSKEEAEKIWSDFPMIRSEVDDCSVSGVEEL